MIEKRISIGNIEPIDFYGVNNSKFNLLKAYFPKIKITARGDEIILQGELGDIEILSQKINALLEHYHRYNMLTVANLKRIILEDNLVPDPEDADSVILYGNAGKAIRARTENQRKLVELARTNDLLFATGPAGSGKTYTAIALAVRALRNREVKRIVLSRPAVEAGESLGFLPGDMKEKVDPYLQPLYDALSDMIPPKKLEEYLEAETIQIAPPRLHARADAERLVRHPGRGAEHHPQPVENVPHPHGGQRQIRHHRRHEPNRPAPPRRLRTDARLRHPQEHPGHRFRDLRLRRHRPPPLSERNRKSLFGTQTIINIKQRTWMLL